MAPLCARVQDSRYTGYKIFDRPRRAVDAMLARHDLVKRRRRRRAGEACAGTALTQPTEPNALWCADDKGEFIPGNRRYCYPFAITDFAGRLVAPARHPDRTHHAGPSLAQRPTRTHASHAQNRSDVANGGDLLQQQARFDAFVARYEDEGPDQALGMKVPADVYTRSARLYRGLEEVSYPFADTTFTVTHCGRICFHGRKINLSHVFPSQLDGFDPRSPLHS